MRLVTLIRGVTIAFLPLCPISSRDKAPWRIGSASRMRRAARLVLRCARVASPVGAVGIDVERSRGTLDDLFRDHDLCVPKT